MTTLWYSAFLLAIPFGSRAHSLPSDSTAAPRRHLLTLHTLHIVSPLIPALAYEVPVSSRWALRASLGGDHNSYRYTFNYYDDMGVLVSGSTRYRYTGLIADVSLNYYLQARKPALLGWFVGGGVLGAFSRRQVTHDNTGFASRTSHDFLVRPLLRAGRHWALGKRWLLDTHVAVAVSSYPTQRIALNELLGVGAGYRF
ncbi:hypothetical protein [Hymenobacter sp. YC55]|uniref:hypothetical protein n=1 Tax=Hymenobacter sp. YC55 TaxID=3034019 RepID=UPI0023F701A5|nr:hypothetical protein [Hymenobacter sp. YC55]MDF7814188.1 hypothetical protein [Hymenobacter sp. YC55]